MEAPARDKSSSFEFSDSEAEEIRGLMANANKGDEEEPEPEPEEPEPEPEETPEPEEAPEEEPIPAKGTENKEVDVKKAKEPIVEPALEFTAEEVADDPNFNWDNYATEAGIPERGKEAILDKLKSIAKENADLKTKVAAITAITQGSESIEQANSLMRLADEDLVMHHRVYGEKYTKEEAEAEVGDMDEFTMKREATRIRVLLRRNNEAIVANSEKFYKEQKTAEAQQKEVFNTGVITAIRKIEAINGVDLPKDKAKRDVLLSNAEKSYLSGTFQKMLKDPDAIAELFMANHLKGQIQSMLTNRIKNEEKAKIIKTTGNPSKPSVSGVIRPSSMTSKKGQQEKIDAWVKEPGGLHGA